MVIILMKLFYSWIECTHIQHIKIILQGTWQIYVETPEGNSMKRHIHMYIPSHLIGDYSVVRYSQPMCKANGIFTDHSRWSSVVSAHSYR